MAVATRWQCLHCVAAVHLPRRRCACTVSPRVADTQQCEQEARAHRDGAAGAVAVQDVSGAVPAVDADDRAVVEAHAHAPVLKRGEHPYATHGLPRVHRARQHGGFVLGGLVGRRLRGGGGGAREDADGVLPASVRSGLNASTFWVNAGRSERARRRRALCARVFWANAGPFLLRERAGGGAVGASRVARDTTCCCSPRGANECGEKG